jgi:hypothetical protein
VGGTYEFQCHHGFWAFPQRPSSETGWPPFAAPGRLLLNIFTRRNQAASALRGGSPWISVDRRS